MLYFIETDDGNILLLIFFLFILLSLFFGWLMLKNKSDIKIEKKYDILQGLNLIIIFIFIFRLFECMEKIKFAGVLIFLICISLKISIEIVKWICTDELIGNKEIFDDTELKNLEKMTKNLNEEDKIDIYEKYYKKKQEKKYQEMEKIMELLINGKEAEELCIDLLYPYEKILNLTTEEKNEVRINFAEKIKEIKLKKLEKINEKGESLW